MPSQASYPLEWLELVQPRAGHLFVLREEVAPLSGLVIVPESYRNKVKKSNATVFRSGSARFRDGDSVLLAVAVSRRMEFGILGEKVTLYVAHENEILCTLVEGAAMESVGESFFGRAVLPEDYYLVRGDRAEEGLATAIGDQRGRR